MTIDLDKARAARRESNGEAPKLVFGKEKFKLPVELPFACVEWIARMAKLEETADPEAASVATKGFVEALLGGDFDRFMALRPSGDDMGALLEGSLKEYGLTPGEAPASAKS